ncbi:ATP synthase F0 subunit B [Acidicapsa dinghuensis]|uniref:ATP synthase subunit b n=1 Tax=Acidicapsa dinghuensis TaxID=2218256 RepID=A0ABW1EFZ2_9BACT|nr:ATP synthase F0 subunit B [Acidicapsa dinghuensis]
MSFRKLFSIKIAVCLVFGSLIFALPSASRAVFAQEAQPQAQSTPKSQGSFFKQERQAVKQEEAAETDQFRHSATVQWLAKTLHMDVETAATAFEYTNFIVILLFIGIPLYRILPKILRERRAKLSFELDQAKARTADAGDRLKAVEAKLAGLDAEIAQIRKQVAEEMVADEARSKAQLEEETSRVVRGAEHEIAAAAAQAQRGLKQFAANIAVDRALSRMTVDEATDRALFAEFASDVAGSHRGSHGKGEHA